MRPIVPLLLLAACAPEPSHYGVMVGSLPVAEQEKVANATVEWQTALAPDGPTFDLVDVCDKHCIEVYSVSTLGSDGPAVIGGLTLRDESRDRAEVAILETGVDQRTMSHEMGHAIGLGHLGPGTLMCASSLCAANHVTQTDVAAYWVR